MGVYLKKGTGGCNLSLPHKCPNRHVLRSLSNNCWVNKEQQIEGEARERTSHRFTTTHNRTRTRRLSASRGRFLSHISESDGWRGGEKERKKERFCVYMGLECGDKMAIPQHVLPRQCDAPSSLLPLENFEREQAVSESLLQTELPFPRGLMHYIGKELNRTLKNSQGALPRYFRIRFHIKKSFLCSKQALCFTPQH